MDKTIKLLEEIYSDRNWSEIYNKIEQIVKQFDDLQNIN